MHEQNQSTAFGPTSAAMADANATGNWSRTHADNSSAVQTHTDSMVSLNYDLPIMILVAAVLFVVIIATAFGNLLVGLALFKFRYLRTISNYLIGNLALSDFLLATTILPMSTVQECLGHWVFGQFMCNFWLLSDVLYCTASIWNLCIIAFDRFTATLYPLWYREKRSNKQAAIYVALVWIISTAICLPPLFGWNDLNQNYVYNNETNVYNCNLFQTPSYVLYSAAGSFYIPFFITFFLYIRIFTVLRKRMRNMRRAANKRMQSSAAKNKEPLLTSQAPPPTSTAPPSHSIEMTNTKATADTNTEEHSSKSLFGSDSNDKSSDEEGEEESSQADKLLCPPHQEQQPNGKSVLKNGIKGRLQRKGKTSEKAAMLKAASESESDMEKVRIVVTADESSKDADLAAKAASPPPPSAVLNASASECSAVVPAPNAVQVKDDNSNTKVKMNSALLKSVNPFSKGPKKKVRTSTKRRYEQREMRATIRMAIIIAFFCGMWLGFFTIYVIRSWCPADKCPIPRELDAFFFWLGYSNSSINPILYTIFNEEFRKAFQKILGCYHKSRRGSPGRR
jgi:hypothetical protein